MSIKKQITTIESLLNKLETNDIDFEKQIDIYNDALKKMTQLKTTIEQKVSTIQPWE